MLKTYVLLFRGINVGGKHILPMKALRDILESQGYEGVQTYIQSGNVVCQRSTKPGQELGKAIHRQFGFNPPVLALDGKTLEQALNNNPYPDKVGKAVHLFFCATKPTKVAVDALQDFRKNDEQYQLRNKVIYLHAPSGIARSKLVTKIDRSVGTTVTARNLNTVEKLVAMLQSQ